MSDLKPCPDALYCSYCKRSPRPTPELPEGYTCNRYVLWCNGEVVATIGIDTGDLFIDAKGSLEARHIPALTIWLQRNKR